MIKTSVDTYRFNILELVEGLQIKTDKKLTDVKFSGSDVKFVFE